MSDLRTEISLVSRIPDIPGFQNSLHIVGTQYIDFNYVEYIKTERMGKNGSRVYLEDKTGKIY